MLKIITYTISIYALLLSIINLIMIIKKYKQ